MKLVFDLIFVIALFIGVVGLTVIFAEAFVKRNANEFTIKGSSMQPTVYTGDVFKLKPQENQSIGRHDIVVIAHPGGTLLKRVIGMPGDTIILDPDGVWINWKLLVEPYLEQKHIYDFVVYIIPKDYIFVMGDNRSVSVDSRAFGPVPFSLIVGEVFRVK